MERYSKGGSKFAFKHTNHTFNINEIIKLPKIIHAYEQPISSFPALFTVNFMQGSKIKVVLGKMVQMKFFWDIMDIKTHC